MALENPFNDGELIDALRISDAEWYECVQEMDLRAMAESDRENSRAEERQPYRNITKIIVSIRNYDGRMQQFKVRAYDLSPSGLGFLHGAYIYNDTPAELFMLNKTHGMSRIPAKIVSCIHVKSRIHRVGAQFKEPIDLSDFLLSDVA
jgi:hypothetical protein